MWSVWSRNEFQTCHKTSSRCHKTSSSCVTKRVPDMSQNEFQTCHKTSSRRVTKRVPGVSQNEFQTCHKTSSRRVTKRVPDVSQNEFQACHKTSSRYVTSKCFVMRQIWSRIVLRRISKSNPKKCYSNSWLNDHSIFVKFVSKESAKFVNCIVTTSIVHKFVNCIVTTSIVHKYGQTRPTFWE